jgi:hypothetical protein
MNLRDIEENFWNVNSLFILTDKKNEEELEKLAKTWDYNFIQWMSNADTSWCLAESWLVDPPYSVLLVWWD